MRCWRDLVIGYFVVLTIHSKHLVVTMKEISIECASDVDFTFKFYSKGCEKSLTIAECDFVKEECMMLATTHENMYNVMYSRRGGILRITDLDEDTVGTYQCYQTFNPLNAVSTNSRLSDYISTTSTTENCINNSIETTGGQTNKSGHILIGTLQNASLECSSNVGITFRFISNTSKPPVTIAECDFTTKSCTMLQTSLNNKYNLFYTGRGGVLQIASLENETIGEYRCCETFNPTNFISFDITVPYINEVVDTTYDGTEATESTNVLGNGLQKTGINNHTNRMAAVGLIVALVVGLIVLVTSGILIFIAEKRVKLSGASTITEQAETAQLTGMKGQAINPCAEPRDTDTREKTREADLLVYSEKKETDGYDSGYASGKSKERNWGRKKQSKNPGKPNAFDLILYLCKVDVDEDVHEDVH